MNGKNAEPGSRRVTGFLMGVLAVSIAATIAAFWHTEQQTLYSLQYRADADALRVLSPQFARDATAAADGNKDAFIRLDKAQSEFQVKYIALTGSEINPPLTEQQNEEIRTELVALSGAWPDVQVNIQSVLDKKSSVLALHSFAKTLNNLIPLLQSQYDQIVESLLNTGAPAIQIQQAQEQILRSERLSSNLTVVLTGRENFAAAADNFYRDAMLFKRVLNGMNEGDSALNLERINDENIRLQLNSMQAQFKAVTDAVDSVVISAPDLYQIHRASDEIVLGSDALLIDSTMLSESFQAIPNDAGLFVVNNNTAIVIGGLVTLLTLLLAGVQVLIGRRQLQQAMAGQLSDNKAAVAHLLKELDQLAEGDLTIKMTVRDDVTGPIVDAINHAVEQLRMQFTVIDQTSIAVQKTAEDNLQTMRKLTIASEYLRREIIDAATTMKQVVQSLDGMANTVQESITIVEGSLPLVQRSPAAIQAAITSMGDVVERANILSVNAAIKASQGSKVGVGAAIAEEARQLTQHVSKVAQQLEEVVQETSDRSAGESSPLEAVYQKLLVSISEIAETAKTQSLSAGDVAATMNVIREIATQTAQGATASAGLTGNLAELASEMRQSVCEFKLPDVKHVDMDAADSEESSEEIGSEKSEGSINREVGREEAVSKG